MIEKNEEHNYIDITKAYEKDNLDIKIGNINISDIIKNVDNIKIDDYDISDKGNYIVVRSFLNSEYHIIFKFPITIYYDNVIINGKNTNMVDYNISSTIQIENTMKVFKIPTLFFIDIDKKKRNLKKFKFFLVDLINEKNKIIHLSPFEDLNFKEDTFCCDIKAINLEKLSIYFKNYFKYNNEKLSDKVFFMNNERQKLFNYLRFFQFSDDINRFKICGPSDNGKSTCLLVFSRMNKNIIYFNLKEIINLYNDKNKNNNEYFNLIVYELGRIIINNNDFKNKFLAKLIELKMQTPWNIIREIFDFFIKNNIIIIFDQFKKQYIDFTNFDYMDKKLKEKSSNIKIILSSSINDKDLRPEVIKSIEFLKGLPDELCPENQDYYYYFGNLATLEDLKKISKNSDNDSYYLKFNYFDKYKFKIDKSTNKDNELKKIEDNIKNKIYQDFNFGIYSIKDILSDIKSKINKRLEYENCEAILKFISLKYLIISFYDDYFEINYSFPFIEELINKNIEDEDIFEYFKEKKYNRKSQIYNDIKGDYFERATKIGLETENFLPEKITIHLNIQSIIELDEIEKQNDLNKYILQNKKLKEKQYNDILIKKIENFKTTVNQEQPMNYQISLALNNEQKSLTKKKRKRDNKYEKKNIVNNNNINNEDNEKNDYFIENKGSNQNFQNKNLEENPKELINKGNNINILTTINNNQNDINNDINNQITINEYKDEFLNGNILLNQLKKVGKIYDQAFLYGKKDSKIFIGFQMKFFQNSITLNQDMRKSLTKDYIIENSRKILSKLYLDYNIKINRWYYYMILFYDSEEKSYNTHLTEKCVEESLEYIFYDPKKKYFYDKNEIKIEKLILTLFADLNINKINNPYNIFRTDYNLYYEQINKDDKIYTDNSIMIKKAEEFLYEFKINLTNVKRSLKNLLKEKKNINLSGIFTLIKDRPPISPKDNALLLFSTIDKKDLIYLYSENNKFNAGKLIEQQSIDILSIGSLVSRDIFLTFNLS